MRPHQGMATETLSPSERQGESDTLSRASLPFGLLRAFLEGGGAERPSALTKARMSLDIIDQPALGATRIQGGRKSWRRS